MGKLLKRENSHPVCFAKDFCGNLSAKYFFDAWSPARSGAFEDEETAIPKRVFGACIRDSQ